MAVTPDATLRTDALGRCTLLLLGRRTWIAAVITWDTLTGVLGHFEGDDRASYEVALEANKGLLARQNNCTYRDGSSGALRLLTTLFTPSTDWVTRSASSFSARDVTAPVNRTVPPCERI